MNTLRFSSHELEAYLDEALDAERMAHIERALRRDPQLLEALREILARRDAGVHSLSEIWRRHQIGVPREDEMGSYLLKGPVDEKMAYIQFRLETLKCRYTGALHDALKRKHESEDAAAAVRRQRYFQSSVGHLSHEG